MSAAGAADVITELRHRGWQCFASVSVPQQVDRCFGAPPLSTEGESGTVWLVHARSRAAGGGPVIFAEVYGQEGHTADPGTHLADSTVSVLAARLLGAQPGAVTGINGNATVSGITVFHPQPWRFELMDQHLPSPKDPRTPALARTADVQTALSRALPGWRCTRSTDELRCTGKIGSGRTFVLFASSDGTAVDSWTLAAPGTTPKAQLGTVLEQEITTAATVGIIDSRQASYLRAHRAIGVIADIDGHSVSMQDASDPILSVDEITTER